MKLKFYFCIYFIFYSKFDGLKATPGSTWMVSLGWQEKW